jgi:polysaccharide pyruvyl transferase WcaK-like protein
VSAPRRRRIYVDHGEAYGNLGDEAMLRSALARLETHLGPVGFVLPREDARPLPDLSAHDIETVPSPYAAFAEADRWLSGKATIAKVVRRQPIELTSLAARIAARAGALGADFGRFRAALGSCDAFYGVGAADFNDYNLAGAAYKCWLYEVARSAVPVVAVAAQGFGPLRDPGLGRLMRRAFDRVHVLSFRDAAFSARYTRSLGPLRCETRIVGDEAFALPDAPRPECDAYLAACGISPGERYVAVHWRATDYTRDTHRFYPRVAAAFDMVAERAGAPLVYVPMSYDVHSRLDEECGRALRGLMARGDRLCIGPVSKDVRLLKSVIGGALFSFGLSYHVHVFALSHGKPAIILSSGEYYRYKSDGLVGFYGPPCAALDVEAAPETVGQAIDSVLSGHAAAQERIRAVNAQIASVNDWTLERLRGLLEEHGR